LSSRNKGAIRERRRKEGREMAGRTPPGISRHSCSRRERSFRLFTISVTFTFLIFYFLNVCLVFFFSDQFPTHHLQHASCCCLAGWRDLFLPVQIGLSRVRHCSAVLVWWSPAFWEVTNIRPPEEKSHLCAWPELSRLCPRDLCLSSVSQTCF
jgi:hypothetical protein